ncbi:D-galactoside/L-rhamnose binding SUEL lectin domain-containing protein [Artemisia annua]|uniref:D-galactoside/L-rhamnose binding SUEL lectin domain-containing protein n=1 Tax=Artemisia annua TaxID=35608 RepID=A0A2U1LFH3_ARTAN|nr:D-galactoside/L-rhamnose binding SUEL lectin domain-containing protein [Artemisia annua]
MELQVSLANHVQQPLKWYKAYFDAPAGNVPLAMDLKHMVRCQASIDVMEVSANENFALVLEL